MMTSPTYHQPLQTPISSQAVHLILKADILLKGYMKKSKISKPSFRSNG